MDYNTTREKMTIPEYGRNVQKMIEYTVGIEDREKRSKSAAYIVKVMAQLNPSIQQSEDYQHTLWDHMHIIADYKLDVDGPYNMPEREARERKPDQLNYSIPKIRLRHYGKTIEDIIQKAIEYEEGEEKQALIFAIANYMKRSYLSWNRDSVSDAIIAQHLEDMSRGNLIFNQEQPLISVSEVVQKRKPVVTQKKKKPMQKSYGGYKKKHYK